MKRLTLASLLLALTAVGAVAAPCLIQISQPPTAAELGIDTAHASAWNALRGESIRFRADARDTMRHELDRLDALLGNADPDLRTFSVSAQQQMDQLIQRGRALRERQLELYEQLPPTEQAHVRSALKARLEQLRRWRERIGDPAGLPL